MEKNIGGKFSNYVRKCETKNAIVNYKSGDLKSANGITLVALVVTIIVLLILAGVSLSAVFSQDGIFRRASKSATITEVAKIEETAQMIYSEKIMENAENNKGSQVETSEVITKLQELGYHIEKRPVAEGDITDISLDKTNITMGKNKTAEIKVTYVGAEDPFIYYVEVDEEYYKMNSNKGNITIEKTPSGLTSSDFGGAGGSDSISSALVITTNPTNIITAVLKEGSNNTIEIASSETEGDTTITVKYGSYTKTCTVKVIEPILVTGITLNKAKDVVTGGLSWTNDAELVATITPENADNKEIKWESSNPSIATVDSNGLVKAGTIGGDVTITATTKDGSNLSATCTITTEIFGAINSVDNIDYTDKENSKATVPKGFAVGTSDNVSKISKGLVIQDITGNQWVWIPCYLDDNGVKKGQQMYSQATEYKRTDFGKQDGSYSTYREALDGTDEASIKKYGGFYIGRYEAGKVGTDTVVIKRNQTPYNSIAIADCKTKSTNFASANSYETDKVYTKLVSSYAWDTALTFIDKTVSNYSTNSTQGNYSGSLENTGLTEAVCNVYDMGGNLWEYTSESYSDVRIPYVRRGGGYNHSDSVYPVGTRSRHNSGSDNDVTGFRPLLYLK